MRQLQQQTGGWSVGADVWSDVTAGAKCDAATIAEDEGRILPYVLIVIW